jgi:site-specific recombinase XerD
MDIEIDFGDLLQRFGQHLLGGGKSPHTLVAYRRDVRLFAEWFATTNGKSLTPEAITPIDVRQYRGYLLTVKGGKPATVNRKLASLSALYL